MSGKRSARTTKGVKRKSDSNQADELELAVALAAPGSKAHKSALAALAAARASGSGSSTGSGSATAPPLQSNTPATAADVPPLPSLPVVSAAAGGITYRPTAPPGRAAAAAAASGGGSGGSSGSGAAKAAKPKPKPAPKPAVAKYDDTDSDAEGGGGSDDDASIPVGTSHEQSFKSNSGWKANRIANGAKGPGGRVMWKNVRQIIASEHYDSVPYSVPTCKCVNRPLNRSIDPSSDADHFLSVADVSIESRASALPPKRYCDLTGLIGCYREKHSRLFYHSADLYPIVKDVLSMEQVNQLLALRGVYTKIK